MPHILLLGCINDLTENLTALKTAVEAADELLEEGPNEELHNMLESIQTYVCGAESQVETYTEDLNALMK